MVVLLVYFMAPELWNPFYGSLTAESWRSSSMMATVLVTSDTVTKCRVIPELLTCITDEQ